MIRNVTHKDLIKRNFEFKLMYGDCPIYTRDGFGYLFKERGDKLEQIMNAYQNEVNPKYKPISYLKERMHKIDNGEEMGLNNLPIDYSLLSEMCGTIVYKGTQMQILREDGDE